MAERTAAGRSPSPLHGDDVDVSPATLSPASKNPSRAPSSHATTGPIQQAVLTAITTNGKVSPSSSLSSPPRQMRKSAGSADCGAGGDEMMLESVDAASSQLRQGTGRAAATRRFDPVALELPSQQQQADDVAGSPSGTSASSMSPPRAVPNLESPLVLSQTATGLVVVSSTSGSEAVVESTPSAALARQSTSSEFNTARHGTGARVSDATPRSRMPLPADNTATPSPSQRLRITATDAARTDGDAANGTDLSASADLSSPIGTPFRRCDTGVTSTRRPALPGQASQSLMGSQLEAYSPAAAGGSTPPADLREDGHSGEGRPPPRGSLIMSPPTPLRASFAEQRPAASSSGGGGVRLSLTPQPGSGSGPRTHERVDSGIGADEASPLTATRKDRHGKATATPTKPALVDTPPRYDDDDGGGENVSATAPAVRTVGSGEGSSGGQRPLLSGSSGGATSTKEHAPSSSSTVATGGVVPRPGGSAAPTKATSNSPATGGVPRPGTAAPPATRRPIPLRPPHDVCVFGCLAGKAMPGWLATAVLRVLPMVLAVTAFLLACVLPSTLRRRDNDTREWLQVSRGCVAMFAFSIVFIFWSRSFATAFWPQRGRFTYDQVKHLASLRVPVTPMGGGAVCLAVVGPLYHAAGIFALNDGVLPARSAIRAVASGLLWSPIPPAAIDATTDATNTHAYVMYWLVIALALVVVILCLVAGGLFSLDTASKGHGCTATLGRAAFAGCYGLAMVLVVPVCVKLMSSVACVDVDIRRLDPTNATASPVVVRELRSVVSPATDACGSGAHVGNIVAASLVTYFLAGPMAWFLAARLRILEKDDEPSTAARCIKMDLTNIGFEVFTSAVLFTCVAVGYGGLAVAAVTFALDLAGLVIAWFSLPSSVLFLCGAWRSGRVINAVSSGAALSLAVHRGVIGTTAATLRVESSLSTADVTVLALWGAAVAVTLAVAVRKWVQQPGSFSCFEATDEGLSLTGVHF